jgi:hypothetical protein
MEKKKIITKPTVRMKLSSIRIPEGDVPLIIAACFSAGESQSQFLRIAVKERALRILGSDQQKLIVNQ